MEIGDAFLSENNGRTCLKQTLQYGNIGFYPDNFVISPGLKQTLQYGNYIKACVIANGITGLKQTLQYGNFVELHRILHFQLV